jgi:radical SAM protein (TIGR01212 family)
MGCPNRDGTLGKGGCIFCSAGGSGDFAAGKRLKPGMSTSRIRQNNTLAMPIADQIHAAKLLVSKKIPPSGPFIAYFQSFTNTYAPVSYLRELFTQAICRREIAALSIATRPDCLEPEKIQLLKELNQIKPVWAELGLQTIHPETADFIRRGYPLSCFEASARQLKAAGLTVIVHLILGLPGESPRQMLESVDYLAHFSPSIDGIKLQLLHVLKGTDLAKLYLQNPFPLFSLEEYVDFVITCLERLPPSMVIHRLTGDGPKSLLLAPAWSADKKRVLNTFTRRFCERESWQGKEFAKKPE